MKIGAGVFRFFNSLYNVPRCRLQVPGCLLLLSVFIVQSASAATLAGTDVPDISTFDHIETGFPLDGHHSNVDCESCHIGGVFDELPSQCAACHDNVFATGQSPDHIPTVEPCDFCHTTLGFESSALLTSSIDHTAVGSTPCVVCHNGTNATGKSADHLSTSNFCEACHNVNSWLPATTVDHDQVNGACYSCHNGLTASGKTANHIPTSNVCEACHAVTYWAPVITVDHNQVTGTCTGCHDGILATGKPAGHIPTQQECSNCHNVFSWNTVSFDHSEIGSQTCISCHNGVTASGKVPGHIITTDLCEACHNTNAWRPTVNVDHDNVIGSCFSCHNNVLAAGKPVTHFSTSDVCEACHQPAPAPWAPAFTVDHNEVQGVCSSCHDGILATGKGPNHIITTSECDICHVTTSWATSGGGVPDHGGFVNNCISCHDGVTASGKSGTHINSTDLCDACHQAFPATWTPLAPSAVDHSQVFGACASCHNGNIASGKLPGHINSSDQCDACHLPGPTSWSPVPSTAVDHGQVFGVCSSCHDGIIATGKGPSHIVTSAECDSCHTTQNWLVAGGGTPDHSGFVNNCISCHDGVTASGKHAQHIPSGNLCDACHQPFPATWAPVQSTAVDHSQVLGTCATCHDGIVASGKSTAHINSTNVCDACHAPGPTPWAPVANSSVDHNQVIGVCSSCHDGIIATGKGPGHVVTLDECDSCHTTLDWTVAGGGGGTPDHSTFVNNCISCHDGVTASGKSAAHITTTDVCDACHQKFPAAWAPVSVASVDHSHVLGTCVSCHNGTTASGKPPAHISATDVCDACHLPGPNPWAPVPASSVDHTAVIGTCADCHSLPGGHINTTNICDACHQPGPIPWTPVSPTSVDHSQVLGICSDCHALPAGHINTTTVCDACHQPGPIPWTPVVASAVDHNEVLGRCDSCHALPGGHCTITAGQDCSDCHLPGPSSWANTIAGCDAVGGGGGGAGGGGGGGGGATPLPPTAVINGPTTATSGTAVTFDAIGSNTLPPGNPMDYSWDMGDGSPIVSGVSTVTHTFTVTVTTTYTVTVTVTDTVNGLSASATLAVTVNPCTMMMMCP